MFELDADTGEMSPVSTTKSRNPTYLAFHGGFAYSSNEYLGQGCVSSYSVDPQDGSLYLQNSLVIPEGSSTCQIAISPCGNWLYAANYYSGNIAVCPIGQNGALGPAATVYQHEGSSVIPSRQSEPHAHSVNPDPAGKYIVAADLGADRLFIYRTDGRTGALLANDRQAAIPVKPGEGPRHFAFHPNGKYAYLSTEIGDHVVVYDCDCQNGILAEKQMLSTLPQGYDGENHTAHIAVSEDGRHVLVSNRGHNSIAVFTIDPQNGTLTLSDHADSHGHWPRHFCLGPDQSTLIVANHLSDTVAVFAFDASAGKIGKLIWEEKIPSPAYVAWR